MARGHLTEALQVAGYADAFMPPPDVAVSADDIPAFVSRTSAVLVGRLSEQRCYVSDDRNVISGFTLTVEITAKGNIPVGARPTVVIRGGRIVFPNGTWAQVTNEDRIFPADGDRVLLFLNPATYKVEPLKLRSQPYRPLQIAETVGGFFVKDDDRLVSMVASAPDNVGSFAGALHGRRAFDVVELVRRLTKQ